ncbi:unnamed protein product [Caenorhabditis auriculariae]|uniref:CX domain-containing protein n=1 Tax=Caenorhabditis auriculariae TaxID=2777116 RepID=A0A8S1GQF6_9PELO|nr:unnamed protein product [Caenorhabditis auriculariae]
MRWTGWLLLAFLTAAALVAESKGGRGGGGGRGRSASRSASSGSRFHFTRKYAKPGSIEHTSMFRSTLFGATAGYLAYSAGRHIIREPSAPMSYGGKTYYWDGNYYQPTEAYPVQCVNKIDPNDPQFGRVYFENETRPHEIVYGCKSEDYCCGFDCCQESTFFTSLFSLLVLILVMSIASIFVIECAFNTTYLCHCVIFVCLGS